MSLQSLEIKIDEVLLQPDFAVIKRRGQFEIASGRNTIQLINLDPNLNEDSIRLIVSGESIVIHNFKKRRLKLMKLSLQWRRKLMCKGKK